MSFWSHWVWPAGASGGIPGDVVGSVVYTVIAVLVGSALYPPLRRRLERWVHRHLEAHMGELHRKLDHIIAHHPDIPDLPPSTEEKRP